MPYISPAGAEAVKLYQYRGGDLSYYYIYLLTPMNKFLINLFPMWIAPNVITVLGLVFTFSSNILTAIYSPDFDTPLPGWICFYVVFSLFIYQTLDNLDGRQARRTNSSSPLGLLFDHGIDAVNITVATTAVLTVFRVGSTWDLYLLWTISLAAFFFATWEEYYTGSLILFRFNGPSDGVLLCMICCALQGTGLVDWGSSFGSNFPFLNNFGISARFLQKPTYKGLLYVQSFAVVLTIIGHAIGAFKAQLNQGKGIFGVFGAVYRASPFIVHMLILSIWISFSPSQIFVLHPRIFIAANGFIFCQVVCMVMLAHICGEKYWPKSTAPVLAPLFLVALTSITKWPFVIPETNSLIILLIWSFLCWFHMVYFVIHELTAILQIQCFSIPHHTKTVIADEDQQIFATSPTRSESDGSFKSSIRHRSISSNQSTDD